jgi:hypothetical protein
MCKAELYCQSIVVALSQYWNSAIRVIAALSAEAFDLAQENV